MTQITIKPQKCSCGREQALIFYQREMRCYYCVQEKIAGNEDLIILEAAKIIEKRKQNGNQSVSEL